MLNAATPIPLRVRRASSLPLSLPLVAAALQRREVVRAPPRSSCAWSHRARAGGIATETSDDRVVVGLASFRTTSINDAHVFRFPSRAEDPQSAVDRHSGVFAIVTEVAAPPNNPLDFPFLGDAMIAVNNVVPRDDGTVQLVLRVAPEFFELNVSVQFLVSND
jgi:hypothetical protein